MKRYTSVSDRVKGGTTQVSISSHGEGFIADSVRRKWQSMLNMTVKILDVPSSLIMRLDDDCLHVFLVGNNEANIFNVGDQACLLEGHYCETVISSKDALVVPNALESSVWRDTVEVNAGMVSYLGQPICWPNGDVFGTLCVVDYQAHHFSEELQAFYLHIKETIEEDLELLVVNDELRTKNLQLDQSNQTKTKLLSLISHDVRGNVFTADEVLRMLDEDFEDYSRSDLKQMIASVSQSISSVCLTLEDLLTWAKNDLVNIAPAIAVVDVVEIVDELLLYFQQKVQLKNITLTADYYAKQVLVNADRRMLTVGVRNIISNALKYTSKDGAVTVKVTQTGASCKIEVIDDGVGICEADIQKMFCYNSDHSKSGTCGESSAGIGLMITKEFLDKTNASLSVASELGKGSVFTIEI